MKAILTGNEAVARGAYEAGVHFASAYPGTPSTEILENITRYPEIISEWTPNEKVAAEAAIGASIAGGRSLAAMKHVGLNVAADPMFTFAYTGVNGGMVLVSADDPGQHSSQDEQDNRRYAAFMKIPMLEPADSAEARDMTALAFELSEQFDTPVLLRLTTRVCHSKSVVQLGERRDIPVRPYVKQVEKYITVPLYATQMRRRVEVRLEALHEYSEQTPLNYTENNSGEVGVIASGVCYQYAREVFGEKASYLKLGFTHPLPRLKMADFCRSVKTIYVIEENDSLIEDTVRQLGFDCHGRDTFPVWGEKTPDVIRAGLGGAATPTLAYTGEPALPRPPALCAGCPHRGIFYTLGRRKDIVVAGDIGCYSLGYAPPYNALDFNNCMGASLSTAAGAQKVLDLTPGNKTRMVGVLGDSTFFHTGINALMEVAYNGANTVSIILDNRITGMTGHQENPGSGYTAGGSAAPVMDIQKLVEAVGIEHVAVIDPNDLALVEGTLDWALALDAPSVIITRWPCALKHLSAEDKSEFPGAFTAHYAVEPGACTGCRLCTGCGCPALSFDSNRKKAVIDRTRCLGCGVCGQVCKMQAIVREAD